MFLNGLSLDWVHEFLLVLDQRPLSAETCSRLLSLMPPPQALRLVGLLLVVLSFLFSFLFLAFPFSSFQQGGPKRAIVLICNSEKANWDYRRRGNFKQQRWMPVTAPPERSFWHRKCNYGQQVTFWVF